MTACTGCVPSAGLPGLGLKLLLQSGDQYLFLPQNWTHEAGTAFLIPRDDTIRLEFNPPGQPPHSAC